MNKPLREQIEKHKTPIEISKRLEASPLLKSVYDVVLASRTEGVVGGKTKWLAFADAEQILALLTSVIDGLKKDMEWLDDARQYVVENTQFSDELKLFYMTLLNYSNIEAWRDYINDGYPPKDAINEDMTYLD